MTADLITAVLALFVYASDAQTTGTPERWETGTAMQAQAVATGHATGDCEDFATLVVHRARAAGLPARYVLARTETGELHVVADVQGWIADVRAPRAVLRSELDYTWLAASGLRAGEPWRVINAEDTNE